MKFVISGIIVLVGILGLIGLMIPSVDALESKNHSISAGGQIFSYDIPIVGTLSASMKYVFDFEVLKPSSIIAGESNEIILSPTNGQILTTFSLNGETSTFSKNVGIGNKGTIPIPFTVVGQIIVVPTVYVAPTASANSHMSPELLEWTTMSSKKFNLSINKNFQNVDTTVKLPMAIKFDVGGNINLFITDIDLRDIIGSEPFVYEVKPVISEKITIIKYKQTYTTLHVTDGSKPEYVKIKSEIKSENGKSLSGYSSSVYVDGNYKTKINAGQWSSDIFTGSGTHNFQITFDEIQDKYDSSTIYKSSKDSKQFTVKSKPTPQSSQSSSQSSINKNLTCGKGTHEENGKCVVDEMFGGGCLIATATYGSELTPEVQKLREIRDNQLLGTESGTSFMNNFNKIYYSFSPAIADLERENPLFREMVKITITPMITSLSILNYVDMNSESSALGYGISLIILNVGMYFVAPAIIIVGIKKKI